MISDEFQTIADLGWWSNGYLLTLSSFQLFYGKLYSLFSIKIVYLVAIALFEVGSLVCTTAPNSASLVTGRAIAGLGAAGIFVRNQLDLGCYVDPRHYCVSTLVFDTKFSVLVLSFGTRTI